MLRGFGLSPAASRSFVMGVALSAVMVAAPAFAQDAAPPAEMLTLAQLMQVEVGKIKRPWTRNTLIVQ